MRESTFATVQLGVGDDGRYYLRCEWRTLGQTDRYGPFETIELARAKRERLVELIRKMLDEQGVRTSIGWPS